MSIARHSVTSLLAVLTSVAGCAPERPRPDLSDGRQHFTQDHTNTTIGCGGAPFQVDAYRVTLKLTGPCREVIVAGDHNDVETDVLPGGTVQITGSHNDVTWRQMAPGPRPALLNSGRGNTFRNGGFEGG